MILNKDSMIINGRYNWMYQPERLIYLGKIGYWHQFSKVEDPNKVWCEVTDNDLENFEETK